MRHAAATWTTKFRSKGAGKIVHLALTVQKDRYENLKQFHGVV
jgi:hypothetical protein